MHNRSTQTDLLYHFIREAFHNRLSRKSTDSFGNLPCLEMKAALQVLLPLLRDQCFLCPADRFEVAPA